MSLASDDLSERIRRLTPHLHLIERKMFGASAFMLHGNMLVAPLGEGSLLVRVGKERMEEAQAKPGVSLMSMSGRTMGGFVVVSGDEVEDDAALEGWIDYARTLVETLPPK
jgi:hypothetical protein